MADEEEEYIWNVDLEVNFLHAMRRHKPVGVNKHFQMACIHERFNAFATSAKKASSKQLWKKLSTLYDLSALDESEIIPFPNKDQDFILPDEFTDQDSKASGETPTGKTDGNKVSKGSSDKVSDKHVERIKEEIKESPTAGTPKRDSRKRTRGTTQSPAGGDTPTTSKRARRT